MDVSIPTLIRVPPRGASSHSRSNSVNHHSRSNSINNNFSDKSPYIGSPGLPSPLAPTSSPVTESFPFPPFLHDWDVDTVGRWLELNGFSKYKEAFRLNEINGELLQELNYPILTDLGVPKTGEKAKILNLIKLVKRKQLQYENSEISNSNHQGGGFVKNGQYNQSTTLSVLNQLSSSPSNRNPFNLWKPQKSDEAETYSGVTLSRGESNSSLNSQSQNVFLPSQLSIAARRQILEHNSTIIATPPLSVNISPRSYSLKKVNSSTALTSQNDSERAQLNVDIYSRYNANDSNGSASPNQNSASPVHVYDDAFQRFIAGEMEDSKPVLARKESDFEAKDPPKLDIMNDEKIRAKCIRVTGVDNQSHIISIEGITSADALRLRVFKKFNIMGEQEREKYAIFVGDSESDKRVRRLDDEELLQICRSNSEMKSHLTLRKEYVYSDDARQKQLQKMMDLVGYEAASQAADVASLKSNKGKAPELKNLKFGDSIVGDVLNMRAQVEMLNVNAKSPSQKLAKFFGESYVKSGGKSKVAPPTPMKVQIPPRRVHHAHSVDQMKPPKLAPSHSKSPPPNDLPTNNKQKKLTVFFGERPPDDIIAEQLEQYFKIDPADALAISAKSTSELSPPKLPDSYHVQQLQKAQAAASVSNLPLPFSSYTPSSSSAVASNSTTKLLKELVRAAATNKRMSKVGRLSMLPMQRKNTSTTAVLGAVVDEPTADDSKDINSPPTQTSPAIPNQLHTKPIPPSIPISIPAATEQESTSPPSLPLPPTPFTSTPNVASNIENFTAESNIPVAPPSSPSAVDPTEPQNIPQVQSSTAEVGITKINLTNASTKIGSESFFGSALDDPKDRPPLPGSEPKKRDSSRTAIRWKQGNLIGQGAFGKVYHALNLDTGEIMAVKQVVLGGDGVGKEAEKMRKKQEDALRREIELLSELDHENIVRYLNYEIKENTFNVFLEYVSGGSIASCLARFGKFDEEFTSSMAMQILSGLEYLHSTKIIHRDIKGANILIDSDGVAKISDFGISKKNEYDMAYQRMTRMSMQGSIYWMAPEVARGKGYSAKVDIWSLGCLVLEMLTGHHPWHKVRGNIIYLLGTGNAPPLPSTLGANARSFLELCFTVDPEKRPTATDLLKHDFTAIDPLSFDFAKWVSAAEEKSQNPQSLSRPRRHRSLSDSVTNASSFDFGQTGEVSEEEEFEEDESEEDDESIGDLDEWVDNDLEIEEVAVVDDDGVEQMEENENI
ncbi:hypothetical protein HK098_005309 [Nowakowskiella sp. JEL0407]|nr:hypothetical protein HK098_005309 [Nowakowskiella sp. JEL0407]